MTQMTLFLFTLVFTSWVGVQADIGLTLSRQYLPADQATNGPPDRQYLPASQQESSSGHFGSTNQFDNPRLDDEDSVSVISALFAGARTAPGAFSRSGPSNQNAISGHSSRTAGGSSNENGYSGSSNRFGDTPSNQYGSPFASSRSGGFNANQVGVSGSTGRFDSGPSSQYGVSTASRRSGGYSNQNEVGSRIGDIPSSQYGAPSASSRFGGVISSQNGGSSAFRRISGAPSSQYGVPDASIPAGGSSYSQNGRSGLSSRLGGVPSSQYDTPASNGLVRSGDALPSRQYGAPGSFNRNAGGVISGQNVAYSHSGRTGGALSTEYGAPSASGRFSGVPSSQYGVPSASSRFGNAASAASGSSSNFGGSAPSSRYGSPSSTDRLSANSQGYQYNADGAGFRNAIGGGFGDEDSLSEPANYEFSYEVEDKDYGTEFGHEESRQYDNARGSYHVLLPDGRTQVVEYEADQDGYKPQIRYEGESEASGRAADGSGPY